MFPCFHFPQIGIWIKVFHDTAIHTLFDSSTECSKLLLLVFQEPEAASDNFTGIVISA